MNGPWSRIGAGLAVLVAAVGVLGLTGQPAYAHNSFSASTPKDKAVLDQVPATVALKFLAKLSPTGTKVSVVDPGGQPAGGPPRFDGPTVIVPLLATVAGVYTASYEVASPDGHPIRGKITFTLTEKAVPSPTPVAPPTSAAAVDVPSPTVTSTPRLASGSDGAGTPTWPWFLIGGVAVAAVAATLIARRSRRGPTDPGPS